ncbi:MAG: LEA type 2 family protein [Gemmatimonadetes bacterium]|nr:LEA type 2 family protein [Gemmatimonadota bacterium]
MHSNRSALLLAASILTACGGSTISPENLAPPTVRVDRLGVKNAGIAGGTMDVVMAIYNPNRSTIKGTAIRGALDIENSHIGDVTSDQEFKLKGRDTTLVTVPMQFKWSGAGAAAKSILGYGTVNYKMNGIVMVATSDGHPVEVPFTGQGSASVLHP